MLRVVWHVLRRWELRVFEGDVEEVDNEGSVRVLRRWVLRGKVGTDGGMGCVEVGIEGCEEEVGIENTEGGVDSVGRVGNKGCVAVGDVEEVGCEGGDEVGLEGYGGVVEEVDCESCKGSEEVGCEDCKSGVEKGDCVEMVMW